MINRGIIDKIDDTIVTLADTSDGADEQIKDLACEAGCALMRLRGYLSARFALSTQREAQESFRPSQQSLSVSAIPPPVVPFPCRATSTSAESPQLPTL